MNRCNDNCKTKLRSHTSNYPGATTVFEEIFNNLVLSSLGTATLECSIKVDGNVMHARRMNLWFSKKLAPQEENLAKAQDFLHQCVKLASLNFSIYRQIVGEDFQYDKARCTVIGIDVRSQSHESRVKLWHIIEYYPELEDIILAFPGIASIARCFKVLPELLFGFDFGLNGETVLKVYPVLHDSHIQLLHNLLTHLLGAQTMSLVEQCEKVNFSFTSKKPGMTLHFSPIDPKKFIGNLNHQILSEIYHLSGTPRKVIVSLDQAEIENSSYSTFNFYY